MTQTNRNFGNVYDLKNLSFQSIVSDPLDDVGGDVATLVGVDTYISSASFNQPRSASFNAWYQVCPICF